MLKDFNGSSNLEEAMGGASLDEANGIVKNVVLLTGNKTSYNRTRYLDAAVTEAVGRYEGAKMYVDHPSKTDREERHGVRSVKDLAGTFHGVHRVGDKVVADMHVLEHQRAWVLPLAKARPKGVGLSIRDRGHTRPGEDGVTLVEGFDPKASFSVDLVSEVSLNEDLFESKQTQGGNNMEFDKLTMEQLTEHRKDLVEAILAPVKKDLDEARTELAKQKALELSAQKTAALAEAKLPEPVTAALKGLIMKETVTLAEAKATIADQAKMVKSLEEAFAKRGSSGTPQVKITDTNDKVWTEGKDEMPTADELAEAFRARA